jgi:hypothetical protein
MSAIGFVLVVLALFVLAFLLLSFTKSKWGINLKPLVCPDCGHKAGSRIRIPVNEQQALWGGRTCESCGCEMDKWGRKAGETI